MHILQKIITLAGCLYCLSLSSCHKGFEHKYEGNNRIEEIGAKGSVFIHGNNSQYTITNKAVISHLKIKGMNLSINVMPQATISRCKIEGKNILLIIPKHLKAEPQIKGDNILVQRS